ncbi:hypothetical protein BY458DRAFT_556937 [Sporodiniella umbellata]|nr:hypothetical protein BY458DRAFT_556937 [Sporodiniella umbellata]
MSFNIKNSFVSRSIVQADSEQTLDSDKNAPPVRAQDHDPRTLYERLEEQRNLREEKFAEDSRLSNHIKRLDEEEAEYFKTLSDQKKKLDEEKRIKERLELEKFRQEVEDAKTAPQPLASKVVGTSGSSIGQRRPIVPNKSKNKYKDIVVIKKRDREDDKEGEKKETAESKPEKKAEIKSPEPKKAKVDNGTSLSLLAAYSDDDDDEE